mgnify:CR=1 FL=1
MKSRMKLKGLFPKERMFRHSSTPGCQNSRQKSKKYEQKNQIHMNVTIRFFIDEETLTMAVRHCLHFQIEPSFPNVKKAIRNAVLNNGKSIIDFPESWGDDLMDVNQVEVDKVLKFLMPVLVF